MAGTRVLVDHNGGVDDQLLDEQVAYYRARAPEYDEWWERRGRYDRGDAFARRWQGEVETVQSWLDAAGPFGDVLELAAGTGNWTVELARRSRRVTAVDASPETLAINAAKVRDAGAPAEVDYVEADLFAWYPPRRWDRIFFSFWISHVPDDRLAEFSSLIGRALADGGRVLILDNKGPDTTEREVEEEAQTVALPDATPTPDGLNVRELNDGRRFTIVKVYRSPARLAELLDPLGWKVTGAETANFFTWAELTRV